MLKSLRGVISIQAEGTDVYKFINALREENIPCMCQKCKSGVFYGEIYSRFMTDAETIAEEQGIILKVVKKKGLFYRLFPYRLRFGLLIGLIGTLGLVFYFSNTVITIEVNGNSLVTEKQIVTALNEMGVDRGSFIPCIDFHRCEQQLRLSIPKLSWTGIRHTGSRVIVDVEEGVSSPQMVNDDIPCDIVSMKDAQIVSTEVYAGRLVRRIGDGIKKGGIIISGTVEDGAGNILKKHSMGKIRGIYFDKVTFTQYYVETKQVNTGDREVQRYFDFFGLKIPMFIGDSGAETYEERESENKFSFFGAELPMGIVTRTIEPMEYRRVSYTAKEAEKLVQQKASLYEKNFFDSEDIKILDRSIEKISDNEKTEYRITYKIEGNIGEDREIYVDR